MWSGPKFFGVLAAVVCLVGCASERFELGTVEEALESACGAGLEPHASGVASLGTLPPELGALRWPDAPRITREVTVTNAATLTEHAAVAGTRIRVVGAVGGDARIGASDVEIVADAASSIGQLTIARGVSRAKVSGGRFTSIRLEPPAVWWPAQEWRSEWMVQDVWIDAVRIDSPDMALELRGRRVAVTHSDVHAVRYSVWSGDVGTFQSEDLILYDNFFVSDGPEATVRFVDVARSAVVANTMSNTLKHNYRVHGRSDLNFATRNLLVGTGVMLGRMSGDALGTVWFDGNEMHHTSPDLFNPDGSIRALRARRNVAYTDVTNTFYGGAVSGGWDLSNNTMLRYADATHTVRSTAPAAAAASPSPAPTPVPTPVPAPAPAPAPVPTTGATTDATPVTATSLGNLPVELATLRWPARPQTTREVVVTNAAQLASEAAIAGTRIVARGVNGGDVRVRSNDVEIVLEGASTLGQLSIARGARRIRVSGGTYGGINVEQPAQYYPSLEYRSEWMAEDIAIEGVTVRASNMALEVRGRRIAITRSNISAERYSVWCGDTGPYQTEDLILYDNLFASAGPEATVRLVDVVRSATVQNTLSNTNKHNYRVHGRSDLNYAGRNILVNTGVMLGRMPGDVLGTEWFEDNALHQTAPDLFNPDAAIARLVARRNRAYSNVHGSFYGGSVGARWELASNSLSAYVPPPSSAAR